MRRALGILLLLLTWALVPPVQAQVLRCQSQHLGKQDRSRVLALVRSVLGAEVNGFETECRNPGRALVWVSTPRHPATDGAVEWWTLSCNRRWYKWSCGSAERHLGLDFDAVVTGVTRHIKTEILGEVGIQRARELTTLSLQLLQDPTSAAPAHQCGPLAQPEKDAQAWEKLKAEYLLKPGDEVIRADVFRDESGTISIDLFEGGGPTVTFSADTVDGQPIVDCWGEWVVIT
jgi:hypothetical protein